MFCPDCGTRVWHDREGVDWPTVSIEGGSLDQPLDLSAAVHVWTSRKLPGVVIPEGRGSVSARRLRREPAYSPITLKATALTSLSGFASFSGSSK